MNSKLLSLVLSAGISFSANAQEPKVGEPMWGITGTLEKGSSIVTNSYILDEGIVYIKSVQDKSGNNLWQTILQNCGRGNLEKVLVGVYDFATKTYYMDVESAYNNLPDGNIDKIVKNADVRNFELSSCRILDSA